MTVPAPIEPKARVWAVRVTRLAHRQANDRPTLVTDIPRPPTGQVDQRECIEEGRVACLDGAATSNAIAATAFEGQIARVLSSSL